MLAAFVHYLQNQLSYCLMNFYKFFKIKMGSSRNVFIVFIKNQNYIFYFYKLHMDVLECTGHSKHLLPKHKRRLYTWASPDGQHQNQIDYIFCSQRWRSSIQSAKTRPGADCGSDYELLIAKFRFIEESGENH